MVRKSSYTARGREDIMEVDPATAAEFEQFEKELKRIIEQMNPGDTRDQSSASRIGKYVIEEFLSTRGQANVVLAFDPDLERKVVLKVYKHEYAEQHRNRLLREGRALTQLKSDYVANVLAVEQWGELVFLVLEHIEGRTLGQYKVDQNITIFEANRIVRELAFALEDVHEKKLLHLDLKPQNVMITDAGQIKLIDFGLVQSSAVDATIGDAAGTPSFMSPEIANGDMDRVDRKSDVFGLGGIWYFLLTGRPPISASGKTEAVEKAKSAQVDMQHLDSIYLSTSTRNMLKECLSKEMEDRPELAQIAGRLQPWRQKYGAVAGTIIATLLAAALFLFINNFTAPVNPEPSQPENAFESILLNIESPESVLLKTYRTINEGIAIPSQTKGSIGLTCQIRSGASIEQGDQSDVLMPGADGTFDLLKANRLLFEFESTRRCYVGAVQIEHSVEHGWVPSCIETGGTFSTDLFVANSSSRTENPSLRIQLSDLPSGEVHYVLIVGSKSRFDLSRAIERINQPAGTTQIESADDDLMFFVFRFRVN